MNKDDTLLEPWAEELLKKGSLERPSAHFSEGIMNRIRAEKAIDPSYFKYRPLISRPVWAILISGLIGVVSIIYFSGGAPAGTNYMPPWMQNTSVWFENLRFHFPKVTVSSTTGIAMLIFSFMALVEIPIIQKFMERRTKGYS